MPSLVSRAWYVVATKGSVCCQTLITRGRFLGVVGATLLCLSLHAAESGTVRLEVTPAIMKLGQKVSRTMMLVARNSSSDPIELLGLDWIGAAGISVVNRSGNKTMLTPEGGANWLVEITRTNDSHETAQIHFRLDYKRQMSSGTNVVNCALVSLEIQDRPPVPLERVAEVRVESSLKLLQEPRFGTVYIVVKNKSDSELRVLSIRTNSSEYLVLTNLSEAKTLAPKTEEVFPWKIYAGPRVQSGKHLLLFDVSLAWDDEGRPQTGNILCKYECDVGVLGDSEFLVPLGVPSFLLLPGFLIVTVFAMLWNLFHKEKQFPWTAKSAEFWSLAVILSLIALLAVYWLTKRNVMEAYGLRDVYIVWFGSAAAGLLVWTAVEAIVALLRQAELRKKKRAELEVRLKTFTRDDEPVAVLRKLGRNGKGFYLNQVNVKFEGQDARGFVLQDKDSEHPTVCIAPSIVLSWEAALDEETRARLEKEFNAQVAKVDDPDALANLIETEKGNGITVKWKPSGALRKVTQVPDVAFEGTPPASLVKLE